MKLYTTTATAKQLGVVVETVRLWIQQGKIKTYPAEQGGIGRTQHLIPESEIERIRRLRGDQKRVELPEVE